jgi:hypothetical protein
MATQISDAEFFQQLDLDHPGLDTVRAAVRSGDLAAAREAFAAHLRTRERPVPRPPDPTARARSDEEVLAEAERVLRHVFTFVGYPPAQIGETIRWNEDPVGYDQWPIAFNRHSHWVTLGRAYELIGDERYAREFAAQLLSWIDAMPVQIGERYYQGLEDKEGLTSLSLDAGIRMGQTWVPALYHFRRSPSFTTDALLAMAKSFYEHALYLMMPQHFRKTSNWGAMESNGLFHIGVMFPEFRASRAWRETAAERLYGELDNQVYPDGAQHELSTSYHQVSLRNFLWPLQLATLNGVDLPADYTAKLERMFDFNLGMMMPDGTLPALQDAGEVALGPIYREGYRLFPARRDLLWGATGGAEGEPPARTSWAFPYAGYLVMRSGWGEDDRYLLFDVGPYGHAHQHEDKLNLVLYAGGRAQIIDTGNYNYDASIWRQHILSSAAHNTVLVDGAGQNRRADRSRWDADEPVPHVWRSKEAYDYAEGAYDDGYGELGRVAAHTRRVLWVKPDYWIVTDQLTPADAAPHRYEALFHLNAPAARVEGGAVRTENAGGANLAIHFPADAPGEVRVVAGQEEPLRGWIQHITGPGQTVRPIPVADFQQEGAGTASWLYVLYPLAAGEESPIEAVRGLAVETDGRWATGAEILFRSGERHVFAQRGGGTRLAAAGRETAAHTVWWAFDAQGRAVREIAVP